jgi:predicted DNA-binding protein with PD1-like motif
MDYQIGRIGRVCVARLHDGDDVYACIEGLAAKEGLDRAVVLAVGGIRRGRVVVGPKEPTGPIEPQMEEFDDARELLGVGTLIPDEEGPKLHLHAGIGRGGEQTLVGCPRGGASAFCVLEVVLIELEGIDAVRAVDPELGLKLLSFLKAGPA